MVYSVNKVELLFNGIQIKNFEMFQHRFIKEEDPDPDLDLTITNNSNLEWIEWYAVCNGILIKEMHNTTLKIENTKANDCCPSNF